MQNLLKMPVSPNSGIEDIRTRLEFVITSGIDAVPADAYAKDVAMLICQIEAIDTKLMSLMPKFDLIMDRLNSSTINTKLPPQ